jgi:hypothetical protein
MLAYQHAPRHCGKGRHIEGMGAQYVENLIEVGIAGSSGHGPFYSENILKLPQGGEFLLLQSRTAGADLAIFNRF